MTFKYYASVYLQIKEKELKPGTFYHYRGYIENYFLPVFGDRDISSIKASELRIWVSSLDRSPKTIKHYISVLTGIFQEAVFDEVITKNPVHFVRKPKLNFQVVQPFTRLEMDKILENSKNYNFRLYLYIAFFTGMRSGEIIGLKKDDIDLENRFLYIKRSRGRYGDLTPKTKSGFRVVPILDDLYPILENHLINLNQDYLFVTQYGVPYSDTGVFRQHHWQPLLKKLGFPYRKLYNTRHTFASLMLSGGHISPHNLAKILGHRDSSMVFSVYARFMHDNNFEIDLSLTL
jgi:integrase